MLNEIFCSHFRIGILWQDPEKKYRFGNKLGKFLRWDGAKMKHRMFVDVS